MTADKVYTVSAKVQVLDLAKAGSGMNLKVKEGNKVLGTLILGHGSLNWRPKAKKGQPYRIPWADFANILNRHCGY